MDDTFQNQMLKLRVQMRSEIAALQRSLNVTTVYVTHDQVEAMTMGDRVAVMKYGVLQQVDTPDNLYNSPANAFVASFIGSPAMNFSSGMTGIEDGFELHIGGQRLRLPNDFVSGRSGLGNYVGKSVIFGVRPEDFEDATTADDKLELQAKGEVELVESLGSEIIAHFDDDQTRLADVDPDAESDLSNNVPTVGRFDPRSSARIGDEIEVVLDVQRLHFFDVETQISI